MCTYQQTCKILRINANLFDQKYLVRLRRSREIATFLRKLRKISLFSVWHSDCLYLGQVSDISLKGSANASSSVLIPYYRSPDHWIGNGRSRIDRLSALVYRIQA